MNQFTDPATQIRNIVWKIGDQIIENKDEPLEMRFARSPSEANLFKELLEKGILRENPSTSLKIENRVLSAQSTRSYIR